MEYKWNDLAYMVADKIYSYIEYESLFNINKYLEDRLNLKIYCEDSALTIKEHIIKQLKLNNIGYKRLNEIYYDEICGDLMEENKRLKCKIVELGEV